MEDNFENIYYCVSNQKIYIFRNNYKILFVLNLKASSLKKKKKVFQDYSEKKVWKTRLTMSDLATWTRISNWRNTTKNS